MEKYTVPFNLSEILFFFILFFTEEWLIYNVVLVSGVQQSNSVMHIYIYIYTHTYIYFRFFSLIGYYKILSVVICNLDNHSRTSSVVASASWLATIGWLISKEYSSPGSLLFLKYSTDHVSSLLIIL